MRRRRARRNGSKRRNAVDALGQSPPGSSQDRVIPDWRQLVVFQPVADFFQKDLVWLAGLVGDVVRVKSFNGAFCTLTLRSVHLFVWCGTLESGRHRY